MGICLSKLLATPVVHSPLIHAPIIVTTLTPVRVPVHLDEFTVAKIAVHFGSWSRVRQRRDNVVSLLKRDPETHLKLIVQTNLK